MKIKQKLQGVALAVLGNTKRQAITVPILSVLLSLFAGALIYWMLGKSPVDAYLSFLQGAGLYPKENYAGMRSMFTDFMALLNAWTPMIFASLAVCVALRAGIFNIGVSGQMLFAGLVTTMAVGYVELPSYIALPLVAVIGMVSGALIATVMGILKVKWNINEVVTAIMLNYIIRYVASFIIKSYYIDPVTRQSTAILASSRLSLMSTVVGDLKMDISLAVIPAIVVALLMHLLLGHTRLGFEFTVLGKNPKAAQYAGIQVGATTIKAMALSGALAGLAGVTYYMGYLGTIQPDVLISTGFDAIAVALLGALAPIGVLISSFLITVISTGSVYMSSSMGVRQEIASLITGLILLFSACGAYFRHVIEGTRQQLADDKKKEQKKTLREGDETHAG